MSFEVTIEPLGQTIEVEDDQTILDAALRAGIYLPHACCHGLCATCKVDVLEGEVDHGEASSFALMDFERDESKCLACCAIPESDMVIEAEIEEDIDSRNLPVEDFACTVSRIVDLTPTIKGIWLKIQQAGGIDFQAGQYVNLNLPEEIGSRAFSIASIPASSNEIELNIRKIPGGVGTAYIHDQLKEGDSISFSGPYGRFFVKKSADMPMIFMAGGSGLSSPRSMIVELLEEGCELPITLIYGQRSLAELYYHDEFLALAEKYPNFTYIPTLSDAENTTDWTGEVGFVHDAAQRAFNGDFSGNKAYLCGPPLMIDACINTLMQGRLFERDIYTEKFISAADAQQVRSPLFKNI